MVVVVFAVVASLGSTTVAACSATGWWAGSVIGSVVGSVVGSVMGSAVAPSSEAGVVS